jgi:hypothetical protein
MIFATNFLGIIEKKEKNGGHFEKWQSEYSLFWNILQNWQNNFLQYCVLHINYKNFTWVFLCFGRGNIRISNFFKGQTTWQPKIKGCIFPKVCLGKKWDKRKIFWRKKKVEFVICRLCLENVAKIMGFQKNPLCSMTYNQNWISFLFNDHQKQKPWEDLVLFQCLFFKEPLILILRNFFLFFRVKLSLDLGLCLVLWILKLAILVLALFFKIKDLWP